MNKALADIFAGLNAVAAIAFVAIGAAAGRSMARLPDAQVGYAILGGLAGFLVALLVCGALAVVIDMRDTLRRLLELSEGGAPKSPPEGRSEPKL